MGKEKAGFLTPKAIANRIKSKGMQKLRWYCQMCQKQCRLFLSLSSIIALFYLCLCSCTLYTVRADKALFQIYQRWLSGECRSNCRTFYFSSDQCA